jgi:multidrug efflux pump
MKLLRPKLDAIQASLPPGYFMEIGGSEENVVEVSREAALVAIVSIVAIFLALVVQLKSAIKPAIVLAAIPYGGAGALAAIVLMDAPFGFTAILGTISLIGVIVSHIIVLFDYIEEAHERGEPLEDALRDAGIARLRPVLITVGATVFGLVPLAIHGGPLWEPLCYAQIGGLTLATAITLLLVPVLYAVFVLDLKWIRWGPVDGERR